MYICINSFNNCFEILGNLEYEKLSKYGFIKLLLHFSKKTYRGVELRSLRLNYLTDFHLNLFSHLNTETHLFYLFFSYLHISVS